MQTRAAIDSSMGGISTNFNGGEGGIRTLEHLLGCYSLSRRAPSTTRPPLLQRAARVPEAGRAIKSTRRGPRAHWAAARAHRLVPLVQWPEPERLAGSGGWTGSAYSAVARRS